MPQRLLIRLYPDGRRTWRGVADSASSRNGLPAAEDVAAASEIIVVAPAEDVLLIEVSLAARQRGQLLKAVPFAVEDQLLGAIEEQQFALGEPMPAAEGAAPRHLVAIVARRRLREWLDELEAAGIRADVLLPDSSLLHEGEGLIEDGRALLRLATGSAMSCAAESLDEDLRWIAMSARPTLQKVDDGLAALALRLPSQWPVNLLSGDFAPVHRRAVTFGRLRRVALLAAAVVVLAVASRAAEVATLRRTLDQLENAKIAVLQGVLPDRDAASLRGSDVGSVLADRMPGAAGSIDGGVLDLLSRLAPVLGTGTRVELRGLEYRSGTLELALRAPDIPTLESLRERLAAQAGLSVEFTGSNPGSAGVDGRLRIRGATP